MILALLLRPADSTSFKISSSAAEKEPKAIYAALLHDGFFRVTSIENPRGTDYKLEGNVLIMRTFAGRTFRPKIDHDLKFDGIDTSAARFEVPFNHPSFGSPAIVERNPLNLPPQKTAYPPMTIRQEKGWTTPIVIEYAKPEA